MSELREAAPGATGSRDGDLAPIPRAVWAMASVMALGGFLGNMDSSIVAIGLGSMGQRLQVDLAAIQWVVTAYLLGLSAALPLTSWLVRCLGAGRLWLCALTAFLLTSAACALAPSAGLLVATRAVQGMTAGVLIAAGQTVIGLEVGPRRLGRVMGTLGLVVGLAPIVGPAVGGLLLARFSWPALFWLNLPIGVVALVLGLRVVARGERRAPPPMDWPGLVLSFLGLPVLIYALTELGTPTGASESRYLVLAAAGLGACAAFVWWSLRSTHPVLNLRLAAGPVLAPGLLTVLASGASMLGAVLLLPLWFQIRLGAGTASTGLLLMALGVGTIAVMLVAGRLTDRYGGGAVSLAGALVVLLSTAPWPWLGPGTPLPLVLGLLLIRGAGMGMSLMPAMTAAYASVRAADLSDATTLANIVMRVGGTVGAALCVIVLSRGLAVGPAQGFQAAFLVLDVVCLLATGAAARLRHAERGQRGTPAPADPYEKGTE